MLGQGAFSTVWRCVHRATGQVRAIKKISTAELHPREIAHEIALMRLLRHDNVVRCYDVFLEAHYVNIVVDIFAGGDLVDGLNAHRKVRGRVPDAQLAHLTRQMMAAVAHVHSLSIVHRDVKGENFLCDRPDIGDPGCCVALADFGTAIRIEPGEVLHAQVGTPAFWAPEVWEGSYDFAVDVWAVGITACVLLTGALPFEGQEEICRPVGAGQLPMKVPYHATKSCTDFIAACLEKDPDQRPQAAEAAEHPWLEASASRSRGRQGAGSDEALDKASEVLATLVDGLGAIVVGVCHSFNFCLDLLFSPAEAAAGRRPSGLPATSRQETLPPPPPKEEIEKQVTELTSQISLSHNHGERRHQLAFEAHRLPDDADAQVPVG